MSRVDLADVGDGRDRCCLVEPDSEDGCWIYSDLYGIRRSCFGRRSFASSRIEVVGVKVSLVKEDLLASHGDENVCFGHGEDTVEGSV